ncbi:hypothetical protein, conserved [Eimeria brunetti]|uniref:Thioredoxin-like fold domain-containing protein n=1 Tax=Eimeria brunetti TaxID=51314 RepID=U6LFI5_9EIME|nr:hypothetical protein, conserved [Eimeria brunetti]
MIACFGPRRLLVGWCPCSPAYQRNALLKSNVRTPKWFPLSCVSRTCVGSACGSLSTRTVGTSVGSRLHSCSLVASPLDSEEANKPIAINVVVIGTDQCSLCAKALLSIQRIISSLSPPLAYERLPDSLPSAWPLALRSCIARNLRGTNLGLQIRTRKEEAAPAGGPSADAAGVSLVSAAPAVKKGPTAVSSSVYKLRQELPLQGEQRVARNGGSSVSLLQVQAQLQVRVRVGLASLDSAEGREILGLHEGDVQHFREEIPIILVGGKPVSRLKFNGPAVRAALLQELKTLQGRPSETH